MRLAVVAVLSMVTALLVPALLSPVQAAGPLAKYEFNPTPLPGTTTVTLTPKDAAGEKLPAGTQVFLSFSPASGAVPPGSATANGTTLTPAPQGFTTGTDGTIRIGYRVGGAQNSPQAGSTDTITAQNSSSGATVTATDTYTYGVVGFTFFNAAGEEIKDGQIPVKTGDPTVCLEVHAATPGASVFLTAKNQPGVTGTFSAKPQPGSGPLPDQSCAANPASTGEANAVPLTNASSLPMRTDDKARLSVYYKPAAAPATGASPPSGVDSLTAGNRDGTTFARVFKSYDAYKYKISPTPIAAPGSLIQGTTAYVVVQAQDATGADIKGQIPVVLFFDPGSSTNGASARVASPITNNMSSTIPPSSNPCVQATTTQPGGNQPYITEPDGTLTIAYTPGSTAPKADVITAQDACTVPSNKVQTGYSYAALVYALAPTPIAPSGSLNAGQTVPVTLTSSDTTNTVQKGATVFLSFTKASGGGSATACGQTLSATPVSCTTNADTGQLTITYTAPSTLPEGGTDVITAASDPNGSNAKTDSYTFVSGAAGTTATSGYWLVATDGGIFSFGQSKFFGSTGAQKLNQPILGMAATPDNGGYWLVAKDGGIFAFGNAGFFGSTGGTKLNQPIVGIATTPTGKGYWLVASDGGIFGFGDAAFFGSTGGTKLNKPIVGMAATPTGKGYWLVASDGGIFSFGDAAFFGSTGATKLNQPIVGMSATPSGKGYRFVASDGGIFSFGDAGFFGSTGGTKLNKPIVGMTSTSTGKGYWLVASDGGIFSFGDAGFLGSTGGTKLNQPIVGMAAFRTV